ncbi:MAG: DHHA1 domain-containing protein, partial [Anaerorhabdus sp.]
DETIKAARQINGLNVIMLRKENADSSSLKGYAEVLRNKCENSFVFISNVVDDKITFVVASSKEAIEKGLKAGEIAKLAATMSGGNGGGRPDLAQSGGKDSSKLDEIFNTIESKLA